MFTVAAIVGLCHAIQDKKKPVLGGNTTQCSEPVQRVAETPLDQSEVSAVIPIGSRGRRRKVLLGVFSGLQPGLEKRCLEHSMKVPARTTFLSLIILGFHVPFVSACGLEEFTLAQCLLLHQTGLIQLLAFEPGRSG